MSRAAGAKSARKLIRYRSVYSSESVPNLIARRKRKISHGVYPEYAEGFEMTHQGSNDIAAFTSSRCGLTESPLRNLVSQLLCDLGSEPVVGDLVERHLAVGMAPLRLDGFDQRFHADAGGDTCRA